MNNAILFFYGINVSNIKKINNNYYFKYLDNNYGIYLYNRDVLDSFYLYNLNLELLQRRLIGYEIIITNTKEVLFIYENNKYILMKFPNIENRIITYDDIISFNFEVNNNYKKLDKSNWGLLWPQKIDFIEYQFNELSNKYPIISKYFDYYIGIWENAVSYFNNNVNVNKTKYVCHKRININMDLYEFLNPLNFVIDYKERDIGDYLKSFVINKNYTNDHIDKYLKNIKDNSIVLIISRILFPSYFFDIYERIIVDNLDENKILEVKNKNINIIHLLKYIFNRFENKNIPYINWIQKEISH